MSSVADTQPCPYCGETIKANAIKCRFCGEFIDDAHPAAAARSAAAPKAGDDHGAVKLIVPVGRSSWSIASGWLGILALIPFPVFVYAIGMAFAEKAAMPLTYLAAGVNAMFGILAILTAVGAFMSKKPGNGRAIFGIVAGVLGLLVYLVLVLNWERALKWTFDRELEKAPPSVLEQK